MDWGRAKPTYPGRGMTKDKNPRENEDTQTTPEGAERDALGLPGEGGYEIPVPKRKVVMDALRKVARPHKPTDGE